MSVDSLALKVDQNARLVASLVVTGCVLFGSAYIAPRTSLDRVFLVFTSLLLLAGLASTLRWPPLGIIGLTVGSLVVPLAIGTGTESSINAAILGVIGACTLWILDALRRPDSRPRQSRVIPPLLAIAGVATLAFAFGYKPEIAFAETAPLRAQLGGLAIFWLSPLAFFVAGHLMRSARWLAALTWVFISLGGIYILARLAHIAIIADRVFQPGVTDGSLFYLWLVALGFSQAAFNRALRWPLRLAAAVVVTSTLYLGFFQVREWNSGWVPPLAAIVVALWFGKPRLGIAVTLMSMVWLVLNASAVSDFLLTDYKQYDVLTREAAWTTLIPLIRVNPILGLGPANYYWYTPLLTILGYGGVRFSSHEQYMDLILQTGFIGLLCFIWAVSEIGALGIRLRNRVSNGFAQAYIYGALGGLAGTLVAGLLGDWFLPFVYNIGFTGFRSSVLGWIFLGGLLALERQFHTSTGLAREGSNEPVDD